MREELILNLTKDLILRLWSTIPESGEFGTPTKVEMCTQQPTEFRLSRGKKSVVFSTRSFLIIRQDPASKVLGWQEVQ